ncbi:MAG TPA: beta-aspartyl-peptidase [Firmicutes bacterium]|nr:beta-aspartyl-peptidase [Bacillota bacterium]
MQLEMALFRVEKVVAGSETKLRDGVLSVDQDELADKVRTDERLRAVEVRVANPGDSVRIVPVKDVIEPRLRVSGEGYPLPTFPGMIDKAAQVGYGRTLVLRGAAVVTAGAILGFQEGFIDMRGPAAQYSPFSQTHNVVLVCEPVPDLPPHQHEEAMRLAGLRAATYLAQAALPLAPDEVETISWLPTQGGAPNGGRLPRVGYLYMLQSQGLLHDTYLYGADAKHILPTLLSPTEAIDGALVSGNCVSACDKNTTYHHQNNPVIMELCQRHGRDLEFVAVLITNENVTLEDKRLSSSRVATLGGMLGLDGVIISKEGFGNPDTDLMMNCSKLEEIGIKTVLITDEYAGSDGASQSLADAHPAADAVISTGNANQEVELVELDVVIGDPDRLPALAGATGTDNRIELQAVTGATNELGFSNLTARWQ